MLSFFRLFYIALLITILFLVVALAKGGNEEGSSLHSRSAFCMKRGRYYGRHFPLDNPERHVPWVFEAVYDPQTKQVDVTTLSRAACSFNRTTWKYLAKRFPQHRKFLANGLDSNILVSVEDWSDYDYTGGYNPNQGLLGKDMTCAFYRYLSPSSQSRKATSTNHDEEPGNVLVARTGTRVSKEDQIFVSIVGCSTIQITCPAPDKSMTPWDTMRLERRALSQSNTTTTAASPPVLAAAKEGAESSLGDPHTALFPVCSLPSSNSKHKKYKLSVCTATSRSKREHLVEWIEYHRLLGVEHFFIYDTAATTASTTGSLSRQLTDYKSEGIVSVISWPFQNCVRGMGSGRGTWWVDEQLAPGSPFAYFQPPRAIAQTAALASCYSRFKHTSKYMLHMDDDEFFNFNASAFISSSSSSSLPNLVDLADELFEKNPLAPSLRFSPVDMLDCRSVASSSSEQYQYLKHVFGDTVLWNKSPGEVLTDLVHVTGTLPASSPSMHALPRLAVWRHGKRGQQYEGKMLLRTDMVRMFFVHYVTQLEPSFDFAKHKPFDLPWDKASVLHYRVPIQISKAPWGSPIPIYSQGNTSAFCLMWMTSVLQGKDEHKLTYQHIQERLRLETNERYLLRRQLT